MQPVSSVYEKKIIPAAVGGSHQYQSIENLCGSAEHEATNRIIRNLFVVINT